MKNKNEGPQAEWMVDLVKSKNKPVYWNISQGIGKTRAAIQVYQGDKETLKEAKANAEKITKAMNMHDKFLYLLEGFKDMHDYLKGSNLVAYRDHFDMVEELLKEAKQKNKQ